MYGKTLTTYVFKKKCEKTFEILRSEITFLMDLYFHVFFTLRKVFFISFTPSSFNMKNQQQKNSMVGKLIY